MSDLNEEDQRLLPEFERQFLAMGPLMAPGFTLYVSTMNDRSTPIGVCTEGLHTKIAEVLVLQDDINQAVEDGKLAQLYYERLIGKDPSLASHWLEPVKP